MNRNVESHFAEVPTIDIERSIFDRSSTHKTSFNVGDLIPFYVDEVLPGDTFNVTTSKIVRLQTLLTPVLDNLYLDTFFFFCPSRILWTHFKEFCGENNASAWIPSVEYQIPSISSPEGGFDVGTIADYMGLPVGVEWNNTASRRPSALPFRAYALICNEFFRDENLTDPLNIPLGDANQTGSNGSNYINDVANGGKPFKVSRYHDYFSSCLPNSQKLANPVTVPISAGGQIPVRTAQSPVISVDSSNPPWSVQFATGYSSDGTKYQGNYTKIGTSSPYSLSAFSVPTTITGTTNAHIGAGGITAPVNLYADLGDGASSYVSVTELRLAVQLQRYYEKLARSGSRFTEFLRSFFGVSAFDSVLQRPQYLGGNRIQINIHEVTNTAQGEQDFLGDLGALSVTTNINEDFVQSFTEYGYVIGVCCLRYDHSFPQGLERFWSRRKFTDFYLPTFAHLSEMPVYKSEIYADATTMTDDSVFGFQECWADYRFKPDRVSGEMRPGVSGSLASWHFADYYTEAPTLSDAWIREDKSNVDRTLAVTSEVSNQAFMDIYVKNICTRPMPMYSIPGLLDHF